MAIDAIYLIVDYGIKQCLAPMKQALQPKANMILRIVSEPDFSSL